MKIWIWQLVFISACVFVIYSCSKGGGENTGGGGGGNSCSGVTIVVDGSVTNPSSSGASDGSIAATATGGTGLTFSINGGAFQSSGNFTGLAAGSYTVTAKNGSNCQGSKSFTLVAQNQCAGVTINVTGTVTSNTPCGTSSTGSITVTASGGAGSFTYSIDAGAFQSSNVFSSLGAGTHSVIAKDANGCTGSANITVNNVAQGPLFTAVRTLMQTNCVLSGCHADSQTPIFSDPCVIIQNKLKIKARAVDSDPSPMPPTGLLPASERQKITDWLTAGGGYTN